MSGFEIAGIVLGTLPLVVNSALSVKKCLEKSKSWWQFETTFATFIARLREEEIAYRQVVKRLLGPTEISDSEYRRLLDETQTQLWGQPTVCMALQSRLDEVELRWFQDQLEALCQAAQGLHDLLPQEQVLEQDTDLLDKQIYRLKLSFSSEKDRLLGAVSEANDKLHRFLDRDDGVQKSPSKQSTLALTQFHSQASAFNDDLSLWDCACMPEHTVGISLQLRLDEEIPNKRTGSARLDTMIRGGDHTALFGLELLEERIASNDCQESPALPQPGSYSDRVSILVAEIRHKRQRRELMVASQQTRVSALAASNATSSASCLMSPTAMSTVKTHIGPRTHGLKSFIKTRGKRSLPLHSTTDTGDRRVCPKIENGVLSDGRAASQSPLVTDRETRSRDECCVVDDVCGLMERMTLEGRGDRRHAMFQLGRKAKTILRPDRAMDNSKLTVPLTETAKLATVIHTVSSKLKRLEIGLRLSINFVALATTAWFPSSIDHDTMIVLGDFSTRPARNLSGPYFPYRPSRGSGEATVTGGQEARACLLQLGILLLELLHGTRLHQQPSWANALDDSDGIENDTTLFYSAFLWIKRSKSDLEEYFGRDDGGKLYDAIRKCICFDFKYVNDGKEGDARLADAVLRDVVGPLQSCYPVIK